MHFGLGALDRSMHDAPIEVKKESDREMKMCEAERGEREREREKETCGLLIRPF